MPAGLAWLADAADPHIKKTTEIKGKLWTG